MLFRSSNTATLTGNRLLENALVALGVNAGWSIAASGNEMVRSEGMPPLVMVAAGARAAFTNNVLRDGGVASLRLAGDLRAVGNHYIGLPRKGGPPGQAVWGLPGASVELVGNRFEGWRSALMAEGATVVARKNVVKDAVGVAFRVRKPSVAPQVADNDVAGTNVQELLLEPK